jgi:DNA-binding CsgD family transcriptional regulator
MERAQRARRRVIEQVERAAGADVSPDGLYDRLLAALEHVLELEGACWHVTDPASGIPVAGGRAGRPAGDFRRSLEFEFLREDVMRFFELGTRRRPIGVLRHETGGVPRRSPRYREMIEPSGATDELRVVFRDAFGVWGCLTAFSARPFTSGDEDLVAELVAPMARGLRAAQARGHAAGPAVRDAPAVAVLDGADRLLSADPRARASLESLAGEEDVLPGAVCVVAALARRDGAGTARLRDGAGRWLIVDASLLESDPRGQVAVVIQAAPASSVLDTALRSRGLTSREREVASRAVQGRSTKAIAAELHLSPWTVQDHLKACFEKTGVGGRGELAVLATRQAG